MTLESTNFSLNDDEFSKIKKISADIPNEVLILFWQFTIKTISELDIVSNQNLSIEMFLVRLMYLSSLKLKDEIKVESNKSDVKETIDTTPEIKKDIVDQIKNITQEKKIKIEVEDKKNIDSTKIINSLDELIEVCNEN